MMVQPIDPPFFLVMVLMKPSVARSAWARSLSANGRMQERMPRRSSAGFRLDHPDPASSPCRSPADLSGVHPWALGGTARSISMYASQHGEMGELRTADHVADGIDAAVRGLELLVHLDAVLCRRRRRRLRPDAAIF